MHNTLYNSLTGTQMSIEITNGGGTLRKAILKWEPILFWLTPYNMIINQYSSTAVHYKVK